jgi:hypothetical protein
MADPEPTWCPSKGSRWGYDSHHVSNSEIEKNCKHSHIQCMKLKTFSKYMQGTYRNCPSMHPSEGMCSQIQICSKYVQPPKFELGWALLQTSQSYQYNQARVVDPQLHWAMFSHGSRSWGRTIHDIVFLEVSGNKNCATMCHSHTQAYLSMIPLNRCHNQAELTPEVFFSFFPSSGLRGR